jgi:hypothetical protein
MMIVPGKFMPIYVLLCMRSTASGRRVVRRRLGQFLCVMWLAPKAWAADVPCGRRCIGCERDKWDCDVVVMQHLSHVYFAPRD